MPVKAPVGVDKKLHHGRKQGDIKAGGGWGGRGRAGRKNLTLPKIAPLNVNGRLLHRKLKDTEEPMKPYNKTRGDGEGGE